MLLHNCHQTAILTIYFFLQLLSNSWFYHVVWYYSFLTNWITFLFTYSLLWNSLVNNLFYSYYLTHQINLLWCPILVCYFTHWLTLLFSYWYETHWLTTLPLTELQSNLLVNYTVKWLSFHSLVVNNAVK